MTQTYNIYCDESCHLEHDQAQVMVLGAVWCPKERVREISVAIRAIKEKHRARGELKWTKVSPSRQDFFLELIDFFFNIEGLNFRCLIVDDKSKLNHEYFNKGSHDSFYYKMYFYLLRNIISPQEQYRIFLDIKDTRGQVKIEKLRTVLCNYYSNIDYQQMIPIIQLIPSRESELMQLTDFLIGAVSYKNRKLSKNLAKVKVVERLKMRAGLSLTHTTPPWENKFNLFFFSPREARP